MLKSKIHRVTVTEANLDYEGSITIDEDLIEAADIIPYERVDVYNISNGERFRLMSSRGTKFRHCLSQRCRRSEGGERATS